MKKIFICKHKWASEPGREGIRICMKCKEEQWKMMDRFSKETSWRNVDRKSCHEKQG